MSKLAPAALCLTAVMAVLPIGSSRLPIQAGEAAATAPADDVGERVRRLVARLGSNDFRVRERATAELMGMGGDAREALLAAQAKADPEVRERIRLVLRQTAWQLPPALAARLGGFGRSFTGQYLEADAERRGELLGELVSRAPRESEPYVLTALAEDADPQVLELGLNVLRIYRSRAALEAALKFSRSAEPQLRDAAIGSLACFPDEEALRRLVELIGDRDAEMRAGALQALASRGRSARAGAAAAVVKALGDDDATVRETAMYAAGATGAREALDRLWAIAEGRGDKALRPQAIGAIAAIAEPEEKAIADRLAKLISDEECGEAALAALVSMVGRSAAPKVAELLSGPRAAGAADALAAIGGPEQVPALRKCRKERSSEEAAFRAARALVFLRVPAADESVAEMLYSRDESVAGQAARLLLDLDAARWQRSIDRALHGRIPGADDEGRVWLRTAADLADFTEQIGRYADGGATWLYFLKLHGLHAEAARAAERQAVEGTGIEVPGKLGEHLIMAGRGGEGVRLLREAAEMQPFSPLPLNSLAWFQLVSPRAEFRNPAEALKAAERAVAVKRDMPAIADTLAWALFLSGRKEEGLRRQEQALSWAVSTGADGQTFADLELRRARMLAGLGRKEEAAGLIPAILKRQPDNATVLAEGARAWCAAGEPQKALETLSRMIDLMRPDVEMLQNDPDLAAARAEKGFARLLERATDLHARMVEAVDAATRPGAIEDGDGDQDGPRDDVDVEGVPAQFGPWVPPAE